MRVFLDTNVFISAFLTKSVSSTLIDIVAEEYDLVLGEIVLEETTRVLRDRFGVEESLLKEFVADLTSMAIHNEPKPTTPGIIEVRDPDDSVVLQTAMNAEVDILITGDKDLLVLADEIEKPKIMKPRAFLGLIEE